MAEKAHYHVQMSPTDEVTNTGDLIKQVETTNIGDVTNTDEVTNIGDVTNTDEVTKS